MSSLVAQGNRSDNSGALMVQKVTPRKAPLAWRARNALRWGFLWGWLMWHIAPWLAKTTGLTVAASRLGMRAKLKGEWVDFGWVGYRVVVNAFVNNVIDVWDNSGTALVNFNYHGCGTGTGSEAATETALVAESTTIINPDSTRATGSKTQPSANIAQTVGTVNFDGSGTIKEHAVFSQAATGGGIMWDRTQHGDVAVVNGDSIVYTYQWTLNAGG